MTTLPDFSQLSETQLSEQIAIVRRQQESMELALETGKRLLADLEAESERRAVAAYWQAHPELLRLEVGDKLLITEEFIASKRPLFSSFPSSWHIGVLCTVRKIGLKEGSIDIEHGGGTGGVSFDLLQQMRLAYLATHESGGQDDK